MRRRLGLAFLLSVAVLAGACEDKPGIGTAAQIRVVPTSHAFSSVAVGDRDSVRVTVTNIGGAKLTVSGVALAASSSQDFSIPEPPALPKVLSTNQSFAFDVAYRPSDVVADRGRLEVRSDDRQHPVVNVELSTLEIGPAITVEPSTLDFGTVPRGQTQTLTATIKNEGFADLQIENILTNAGSNFGVVQPTSFPMTLTPGATTELRVSYTPTGCAAEEEVIQIFSNDPDSSPFNVTVRGRPPGPAIAALPASVSFGAVNLGDTATQTVTLRSVGDVDLNVSGIALGIGTDAAFTIQAATAPFTLAPTQTRDLVVSYRASIPGVARGAIVVSNDDCDHRQLQIPLDATGTEGPAAMIQVTPATVNFGNVAAGVSGDRTFDVVSIGSLPLSVSGVNLEAGTSSEFSVAAGGGSFQLAACTAPPCPSRTVTMRYTPSAQGSDSGNVIVASNAVNDPNAKVALLGNGAAAGTCMIRSQMLRILDFGNVGLGGYRDKSLTLENNGTGNCKYDGTTILGLPGMGGFRVQSQPGIGSLIGPGQQRQVVIRYQPTALGQSASVGTVRWSDPNPGGTGSGVAMVNLIGNCVEAAIAAIPGNVDYGLITIGCASQVTTVTLYNIGGADLTINSVRLQTTPSKFQLIQAPPGGTIIQGGRSVEVKLRYVPTAVGVDTNTLIVESNDRNHPTLNIPLRGEGTTIIDVVDRFVQSTEPKVDILFMIDNSPSMSEEQTNLRNNFRDFATLARTWNVSFQIGVITTDNAKLRGTPKIIKSSDADPVAEFSANANVGSSGSSTEKGLEMAFQALSDPLVSGDNAGFLRADASLEIIMLSDEDDQSPQSLDFYVAFFYSIKGAGNTSLFHLSSIAGDVPNGCSSSNGDAVEGRRYKDMATRCSGVWGSICDQSFAQTLQAIGNRAFGLRAQFFLSRQPDFGQPFVVKMYANEGACNADPNVTRGTVLPQDPNNGYTYDAQSNSIIFGPQAIPQRGACFKVKYKAACNPV
jgi:hypothetical protein